MQQQEIRLSTAVAATLWVIGLTLVAAGIVTGHNGVPGLGVLSGMAAAVVQIRGFFGDYEQCMRQAFEVGRQHGEQQAVRNLH